MNTNPITRFAQSRTFEILIITVGVIAGILIIFRAGMAVGYRRALFANKNGDSYTQAFGQGQQHGGPGMLFDDFATGHGVVGSIVTMTPTSITVEDRDGTEKTITVGADTVVKKLRATVPIDQLKQGDIIVAIGDPGEDGKISAKLVRILPPPPTLPATQIPTAPASTQ